MNSFLRRSVWIAGLMLAVAGCSPWQLVRTEDHRKPGEFWQYAPLRVTTIYGDTYEGTGLRETTHERLVLELVGSGASEKSGMVLSIPWDKVKAIWRWFPIL